ncbi:suppressor of fused domain protein [Rhodococcoides kroppenstedtii]|uniref:suppressor of fused domain protein n=1 Tax=Rhodococcoides kroppenstedtii TaxID=293050 RepID=UPI0030B8EF5E
MDDAGRTPIEAVRAHVSPRWGGAPVTASRTFLGLEPVDVLLFGHASDGLLRLVSVGCSRHPMTDPTAALTDPVRGPRAELVLTLRLAHRSVTDVWKTLAVLAAAPAVEGVVLTTDALLDAGEPLWPGAPFTAVLLGDSDVEDLPLAEPMDPVRFLAAVPVTATEAAWVRLRGADALREAWSEARIDVRDPTRTAATLGPAG